MASSMENPQISSRRRDEMPESSLRDYWGVRSQLSRDTIRSSRRFSGSHIRSFREEANNAKSFRSSQFTISSTASSPGYPFKEEIDPSTYSFTAALKALQTRSGQCNSWAGECLSPDGFALHSKWNEAEKYICNPLSGQVPMECLSAKTLSGRSFYNKITVSAPLVYSSSSTYPRQIQVNKPAAVVAASQDHHKHVTSPIPESKTESSGSTRDIGTQSTPPPEELSSSGSSPRQTAAVTERSSPLKRHEAEGGEDSPNCKATVLKAAEKPQMERESTKTDGKKKEEVIWRCSSYSNSSSSQGGCLSWMRKRQREKHKTPSKKNIFLRKLEGC
ncbi:unnamed protein product [Linum trigynum]|uniref:Uncharacterized protein n=1 Tax=Linum trigynum TaxID=586398 RepID=A0AAV2EY92_9ROSI